MSPTPEVQAAGGVVWRQDDDGLAVLLVHRPRYDDWSLPKGKLDEGEGFEAAALREIAEETGVLGRLGADLGAVYYTDHKGRAKVVRWWAVEAVGRADADVAHPVPNDEVDETRWVDPEVAEGLVDYDTDREVLSRFRGSRTSHPRATVEQ